MKKLIPIYLLLVMQHQLHAKADTLFPASKISQVTVFFNGAQVSRKVEVKAHKGKNLLIIDKLPESINPKSIQAEASRYCKILSVKHSIGSPYDARKSKDEKEIKEKVEAQEELAKEINNKLAVYEYEEKFLESNSAMGNETHGLSVAKLKEAADFYRTRMLEIKTAIHALRNELKAIEKRIAGLYSEMSKKTINKGKLYSQVLLLVECEREAEEHLKLSYYVATAGWEPLYDFRVDEITKPFMLAYNANVFQSSGEDWTNVKLVLSNANPKLKGDKPELKTWYIGAYQPDADKNYQQAEDGVGAIKGEIREVETNEPLVGATVLVKKDNMQVAATSTDLNGNYAIKPLQEGYYSVSVGMVGMEPLTKNGVRITRNKCSTENFELKASVLQLNEVVVTTLGVSREKKSLCYTSDVINQMASKASGVQIRGNSSAPIEDRKRYGIMSANYLSNSLRATSTSLEYMIDVPYTIPSDGEDYFIKIKETSVPVNYVYYVIPKADPEAFLTVEIPDWQQLNLVSGKSSVYFQGTFTGESYIDAREVRDTLILSLGRDKDLIVKRQGNKEMGDKKMFSGYVKETVGWDITLRNNKPTALRVIVEDQFPVSERKSIEVEVLQTSKAMVATDTGMLSWDLRLEPGEKRVLSYKYSVKYPKETDLSMK